MTPRILLLGEMAGVHGATRLATHAGCNAASLTSNRMTHKSSMMFRGRRNVDKKPSPGRFHTSHIVASSPAEIDKDVGDRKNPLTKQDLVAHLRSGCKPKEEWRVGTEHEKFGFKLDTLEPMTFENIRDILEAMKSRFGYKEVMEGENIIGLKKDGASISLEPGGQFELSGAPFANVHETCNEVNRHLNEVNAVAKELGIGFAGMGFDPKWPVEARPHMPKARYEVIDDFVPTQGESGLEVMYSTCTAQVNLDFSSEKDMINKFRVGLSLQPIATALFANSPFTEGKPNGYLSYRSHVWTVFDDARTGELPFVFDEDFGFDKFTDYALDVPMYMVYRNNRWNNCSGESFKDFMAGKLPQFPGDRPTLSDWMNHLGNIYPEVRLKTYLEMRGADCGAVPFLNALPAFWVGLLYDEESLRGALDITHDWTNKDRDYLRQQVPKHGLRVPFRDGLLQHVAQDILKLSKDGLARRGYSEGVLLEPIEEVARTGVTLAERMLKAYHEKWGGNVDPLYEELAL